MADNSGYQGFISYNRNDRAFGERLERALERYRIPRSFNLPMRRLKIFRDTDDMTGSSYARAIRAHLDLAQKLVVICSPRAAKSTYVAEEIQYFGENHSPEDIIPIIISGKASNEADDPEENAFSKPLLDLLGMPRAIDYRDRINKAPDSRKNRDAWYDLLAGLLDMNRHDVEERDRINKRRVLQVYATIATLVLAGTLALALRLFSTSLKNTSLKLLQSAADMEPLRKAVALGGLVRLPEPEGGLAVVLKVHADLDTISPARYAGDPANNRWQESTVALPGTLSFDSLGSEYAAASAVCDGGATSMETGEIVGRSPDQSVDVVLVSDALLIKRADGLGPVETVCFKTPGGGEGDPLEDRVRFSSYDGPELAKVDRLIVKLAERGNRITGASTIPIIRPTPDVFTLQRVAFASFDDAATIVVESMEGYRYQVKLASPFDE